MVEICFPDVCCLHWDLLLLLLLSGAYICNLCFFFFVCSFFCAKPFQMQCTVSSKSIEEKRLCFRCCWQRLNKTEVKSLKIERKRLLKTMDELTIKEPNPKCRLHWCLIEFIDWRYSHVGNLDSSCELAPTNLLTGSPPPPLPGVNKYRGGLCIYTVQCVTWGDRVVWRAFTGLIHWVFDQIPNLQNCFTTPNKTRRGRGLRQINTCRQVPLQVNFKKSQHLGLESIFFLLVSVHAETPTFSENLAVHNHSCS